MVEIRKFLDRRRFKFGPESKVMPSFRFALKVSLINRKKLVLMEPKPYKFVGQGKENAQGSKILDRKIPWKEFS